jgi:hypothetical protein
MPDYMSELPDTENQNIAEAAIAWEMVKIWIDKNS